MDEGGFLREGVLSSSFEGAGARPRLLERRNGLDHGIYNRWAADGCVSSRQILSEVYWRLSTLPSASEFSAYRLVSGPDPAYLFGWGDDDEN